MYVNHFVYKNQCLRMIYHKIKLYITKCRSYYAVKMICGERLWF